RLADRGLVRLEALGLLERDRRLGPVSLLEQRHASLKERVGVVGGGIGRQVVHGHGSGSGWGAGAVRSSWTKSSTCAATSSFVARSTWRSTWRSPSRPTIVTSFCSE